MLDARRESREGTASDSLRADIMRWQVACLEAAENGRQVLDPDHLLRWNDVGGQLALCLPVAVYKAVFFLFLNRDQTEALVRQMSSAGGLIGSNQMIEAAKSDLHRWALTAQAVVAALDECSSRRLLGGTRLPKNSVWKADTPEAVDELIDAVSSKVTVQLRQGDPITRRRGGRRSLNTNGGRRGEEMPNPDANPRSTTITNRTPRSTEAKPWASGMVTASPRTPPLPDAAYTRSSGSWTPRRRFNEWAASPAEVQRSDLGS